MPLYDYACPQCDEIFEVKQSFNAEPIAACPSCEYPQARRLISKPAILFKGSGFYVNDSRNGQSKGDGDSKSKEASNDSSEKSTETKSENKSETKTKSESKPKVAAESTA